MIYSGVDSYYHIGLSSRGIFLNDLILIIIVSILNVPFREFLALDTTIFGYIGKFKGEVCKLA